MFGELLESRARRVRNRAGVMLSVTSHALFIALAVAATRKPLVARDPVERVFPLPVFPATSPALPIDPTVARGGEPRRTVVRPLETLAPAPVVALPGIPPVDLTAPPATGVGWPSEGPRISTGVASPAGSDGGAEIPFAAGVYKPAMALPGSPPPRYPDILRRARVRGDVVVQVVIDTTGRADMTTLRVLSSDHPLLTDAVMTALPRARFLPAEAGGRKVRMWAVQSFVFEVK